MKRFVSAHPESESVANKDLFCPFAAGNLLDHFVRIGDFAIERGNTRFDDFTGRVNGFLLFFQADQSGVVVTFEW